MLYTYLKEEQANTTVTFPLQNKQKQSPHGLKKNLSSAPGWGYGEGQLLSGCSLSSSCPFTTFLSRQSPWISEERSRASYWMARCQRRSSLSSLVNKATKLFSLSYHKEIRQVGRLCQIKASCFPWTPSKPRGVSAICTQSTGYCGPTAVPHCQTQSLWDRLNSQAAARPGLVKAADFWASTQVHTLSVQSIAAAFCSCYPFCALQTVGASLGEDNIVGLCSKASCSWQERSYSLLGGMKVDWELSSCA